MNWNVKSLWFTDQQDVCTSKCCLAKLCIPQLHACTSHADLYTDVTVMLKANASTAAKVRQS